MAFVIDNAEFLLGLRCPRHLWYRTHKRIVSERNLYRAYQADQDERLRAVCADVDRVPPLDPVVAELELEDGVSLLRARADVLWDSEVGTTLGLLKAQTTLKEQVIWEAAFTAHVFEAAGHAVDAVRVFYLDKSYVYRAGEGYAELISEADVTGQAIGRRAKVREHIGRFFGLLAASESELEERVAPCGRRSCPVCSQAGAEPARTPAGRATPAGATQPGDDATPAGGAAGASRPPTGAAAAPDAGSETAANADAEAELSPKQRAIRDAERRGGPYVEAEAVRSFLEELSYPLHFLDFEAYSEAIPTMEHIAPWEHVPVIYSLHSVDAPGAAPSHRVEAAQPRTDGRKALLATLLEALGETGSIVVYGKGFERRMLERLARTSEPQAAERVTALAGRLVDLSRLFARFHVYHPKQHGSASLKAVHAAFSDGASYAALPVSDGREANVLYYFLRHGFPSGEERDPQTVLHELQRYCSLDTEAMLEIVRTLRSVV